MKKYISIVLLFVAVQALAQYPCIGDSLQNKILANEAYCRGLENFSRGCLLVATKELRRAVYYYPTIHNAYYFISLSLLGTGNHSDALQYFIKAFQLNPVFKHATITKIETEDYNTDFQNLVQNIYISVSFDSLTDFTFRFYGIDRYYLESLKLLSHEQQHNTQ